MNDLIFSELALRDEIAEEGTVPPNEAFACAESSCSDEDEQHSVTAKGILVSCFRPSSLHQSDVGKSNSAPSIRPPSFSSSKRQLTREDGGGASPVLSCARILGREIHSPEELSNGVGGNCGVGLPGNNRRRSKQAEGTGNLQQLNPADKRARRSSIMSLLISK